MISFWLDKMKRDFRDNSIEVVRFLLCECGDVKYGDY